MLNTSLNVGGKFVPEKNALSKDRDPTLISSKIKCLTQEKKLFYRNCTEHKNPESLSSFSRIQGQVRLTTDKSKYGTMADFQTNWETVN